MKGLPTTMLFLGLLGCGDGESLPSDGSYAGPLHDSLCIQLNGRTWCESGASVGRLRVVDRGNIGISLEMHGIPEDVTDDSEEWGLSIELVIPETAVVPYTPRSVAVECRHCGVLHVPCAVQGGLEGYDTACGYFGSGVSDLRVSGTLEDFSEGVLGTISGMWLQEEGSSLEGLARAAPCPVDPDRGSMTSDDKGLQCPGPVDFEITMDLLF